MKAFAGIIITLAILVGVMMWIDSGLPNTTEGVSVVGSNTARLPAQETFILTDDTEAVNIWEITYDGKNTVRFHCQSPICPDINSVTLCGVGCKVTGDAPWPSDDFIVSLREDGAVNVVWPYGWVIRPYEP